MMDHRPARGSKQASLSSAVAISLFQRARHCTLIGAKNSRDDADRLVCASESHGEVRHLGIAHVRTHHDDVVGDETRFRVRGRGHRFPFPDVVMSMSAIAQGCRRHPVATGLQSVATLVRHVRVIGRVGPARPSDVMSEPSSGRKRLGVQTRAIHALFHKIMAVRELADCFVRPTFSVLVVYL